ncbi:MAG: hypothetical protein K9J12_12375 [Melioribacteraceae bacterium]|nr:hypothetical protein [Melioribacteraceae bacterium]MCF8263051.1 hypothetical protein [Melioribacteraceae bacterium]MCF8431257.1 hypothetical protein [Melioribacteraceae bacterium]
MKTIIAVLLFLFSQQILMAQDLTNFYTEHLNINQNGMLVLGAWAATNIVAGTTGYFLSQNAQVKNFHQFNALWNTVNLAIAYFSYTSNIGIDPSSLTNSEILKETNFLQNFLLLNAGLDAAYLMTGIYLKERSKNSEKNSSRLSGYGNGLLVQGAFLLVFDLSLYFIHQNNERLNLYPVIDQFGTIGAGIGLRF